MAKRFTGTEKWGDAWFCSLTPIEKLFWVYLLDTCDNAGLWQVNWPLVQFHLPGFIFCPEKFKDRYVEINPEKWFIPKFIGFQYLTLNPDNRMHQSVISKLQKEGVFKGLASPLQGAKDKDKDKDKVKDKDKEGSGEQKEWFEKIWEEYPQKGRIRKAEALRRFCSSVPDVDTAKRCAAALDRYLESKRVREGYIQNAPTWFGDWLSWENYVEEKADAATPQWMR